MNRPRDSKKKAQSSKSTSDALRHEAERKWDLADQQAARRTGRRAAQALARTTRLSAAQAQTEEIAELKRRLTRAEGELKRRRGRK